MIAVPTMADCSRCGGQVELEKETLWCTNCDWKANLTDAGDECPDCGRVGKKLRKRLHSRHKSLQKGLLNLNG